MASDPFASLHLDLAWFPTVLVPLATAWIAESHAARGGGRLGLAPFNDLTRLVGRNLVATGFVTEEQIAYFDRSGDPNGYGALAEFDPGLLAVLSPNWHLEIVDEIGRHWDREGRVADYFALHDQTMEIGSAAAGLAGLAERGAERGAVEELERWCGDAPVVVVVASTFLFDVESKLGLLARERGYRVVRIAPETAVKPVADFVGSGLGAPFPAVLAWLRRRGVRPGDFWLVTHVLDRFPLEALLRSLDVQQPVLSYINDAWEDGFPRGTEERAVLHYRTTEKYVASEYAAFRGVVRGELSDGLFYKDAIGGEPYMEGCPIPHRQLHTALSRSLFQPPPGPVAARRLVFLGALAHPVEGRGSLYQAGYLDRMFGRVAAQGFDVDVYYPPDSEVAAVWYRERLRDQTRVAFHAGKPIDRLLPGLGGRYAWGWMLTNARGAPSEALVRTGMPSRLYAYLALGIPVLISAHMTGAVEFVESRGIGVAVSEEQVGDLEALLSGVDYGAMVERVLRAREEVCLENCQGEFLELLDQVLRGGGRERRSRL